MNLLLLTETPIIKQIFNLVCKKLNLNITISTETVISTKYDYIIIEDLLFADTQNIKSQCKRFAIITKEKDFYNDKCNFIIPKPFLPSTLLSILSEHINIAKIEVANNINKPLELDIEHDDETLESLDFIETLVDDITHNIDEESDESIVPQSFVGKGGILDHKELSNLQSLLNNNYSVNSLYTTQESKEDDNDWHDLSQIIDQAINEINTYQFTPKTPIKLLLNQYSINELAPLLNKLDQSIIDALTEGEEIELQLKMEIKND